MAQFKPTLQKLESKTLLFHQVNFWDKVNSDNIQKQIGSNLHFLFYETKKE